ncbi:cell wall-binding repeat-containing protein [Bacillus salacetis]|uniref:cell wall-binding repeat-containing protein n=1 Tax=Bacillus salacetis TaxID=2315464 RepID=UPI003B9E9089
MKKIIFKSALTTLLLSGTLLGASAVSAEETSKIKQFSSPVTPLGFDPETGVFTEDEPNNTIETANVFSDEYLGEGSFSKDDKDYYKITVSTDDPFYLAGGSYEEYPSMKLTGKIYNSSKQLVTSTSYDSSVEYGLHAEYQLAPGTYYIELTDANNKGINEQYYFFTYQGADNYIYRIEGANRYETALQVAYNGWFEADEIILATGTNYPDALAGGPLAYYKNAPILLTGKDALHPTVEEAIDTLGVTKVTILGGTSAISQAVETKLKNMGMTTTRISGADRYATAVAIAKKIPNNGTSVVVNGLNYPDALSIAPYAAQNGFPILLTKTDTIPAATLTQSNTYSDTLVIGGTSVVSKTVFNKFKEPMRIGGINRYDTSVQIVEQLGLNTDFVHLATGTNFADALTGSVLAANFNEPILLTPPNKLDPSVKQLFINHGTFGFTILGGYSAVNESVEDEIWSLFE